MGLLIVEAALLLSERFQWFEFNAQKGWTTLIVASIAATMSLFLLIWFAIAAIFRGPFRFTVRSLFILVLAVAVPCNGLATGMKNARRQREAAAAIQQEGGRVKYDRWFGEPVDVRFPTPIAQALSTFGGPRRVVTYQTYAIEEPEPNLPRRLLGDDFFRDVNFAEVQTDAGLEQLAALPRLRTVMRAGFVRITDRGLAGLVDLTELKNLDLSDTRITDAGLVHLRR